MTYCHGRAFAAGAVIGPLLSLLLCGAAANAEDMANPCDPPKMDPNTFATLSSDAKSVDCKAVVDQHSLNLCSWLRYNESYARMKSANDKLMSLLGTEPPLGAKDEFAAAQQAWCAYRNKICSYEENRIEPGTMAVMVGNQCAQEYNEARAAALTAMVQCIEDDDCGHPIEFFWLELHPGQKP